MSLKVLKTPEVGDLAAFSIPEIGEGTQLPKGINDYVVPNYDEFQFEEEIIELPSLSAPSAGDILENAREEAARIVAQAEAHQAALEQSALDQATREANEQLEARINERVEEMREQLAKSLGRIGTLAAEVTARAESDLVDLALQIAKKIVRREVTIDREVALTLVKVSLEKLHNRSIAQVHLNPDDFDFVQADREKLDFCGSLEMIKDRSISPGGCLIQTDTGNIDARIESQFDEIAHGLFS